MRSDFLWALALLAWPAKAAEHRFDFADVRENQTPPGFRSVVTGEGKPGDWRVIMDEVRPLLPPLSPGAPAVAKRAVLARLAQDPTDEHFPLLICEGDIIDDFTLTTRFKPIKDVAEQKWLSPADSARASVFIPRPSRGATSRSTEKC